MEEVNQYKERLMTANMQGSDLNAKIEEIMKKYQGIVSEKDLEIKLLNQTNQDLTQVVRIF